jgi:VWFA-related protein
MLVHWQTRLLLLALLALTDLSLAQDSSNPPALPTFRRTVSEVLVTFFATDASNHPLETLTRSDFAVVDSDQVIRNFRSFTRSDETSLDVIVLVDGSESVAPRFRAAMNDVLQLVAREQSIADDNISVLSFGGTLRQPSVAIRPTMLCSSGCRAPGSVTNLLAVKSGGLTPLFDALIFASDFISHHRRSGGENVRPVLILFSDGNDTISLHSASEAVQAALDAGALIYSVDISNPSSPASGGAFLRQVSDSTGGRYFSPGFSRSNGAAALLNAILEDLRASYVVTYDLPNRQAGFHALRLLPTHNLNLTFHSRNGYDYEPSGH